MQQSTWALSTCHRSKGDNNAVICVRRTSLVAMSRTHAHDTFDDSKRSEDDDHIEIDCAHAHE
ncbi:MAG: hypothetical protein ACR2PS_09990, partial [Pseudomonadales bacterium]